MENKIFYARANTAEIVSLFAIPPIYKFNSDEEATNRLMSFKNKFIHSNPLTIPHDPEKELVLWVREYKVAHSKSKGFYGNFIKLKVNKFYQADKEFYTIGFEDLAIQLKFHPERGIPEQKNRAHPNWGHPVLRKVRNQTEFENDKEAESLLYLLFNQYPNTSYAYPNRIVTMVYSEEYPKKIKSFIFDVVKNENGKYHIVYKENDYKNLGHFKIFNYGLTLLD